MIHFKSRLLYNAQIRSIVRTAFMSTSSSSSDPTSSSSRTKAARQIDPSFYDIPIDTPNNKIPALIERYMNHLHRYEANQYMSDDSKRAFARALQFVEEFYQNKRVAETSDNIGGVKKYVVLDSGCGRGMSTIKLAKKYPDLPVIGIDRSRRRLLTNKHYIPTTGSDDLRDMTSNRLKYLAKYKRWKQGAEEREDEEDDENDGDDMEMDEQDLSADEDTPPNALLLHSELADFWKLVYEHSDWIIAQHYLLHPNPYPKTKHLKKRWHGKQES